MDKNLNRKNKLGIDEIYLDLFKELTRKSIIM